ncbi:hypothetical protein Tco_0774289 [Tanacetum coccineum]|uniref:Reverse transcriptase domain-containing protein n=1 Tax=Tanacetum coccineum TaxID=301880 RepID=A0ABQ4ZS38_9ASTR
MRTRNSNFPNNSNVTILRRRNRGRAPNVVEPELRTIVKVATMAERTMEELLRAPTEGYEEAIVLPEINADHLRLKRIFQQEFSNEFSSYKRTNDQMIRNMQNQINSLKGEVKNEIQNTMKTQQGVLMNQQGVLMNQQNVFQTNLLNMLSGFFQNQASTSGTLLSNTIPNLKGEMKAITTRSDVAYKGPSIPTNPSPKNVVERETEETTDKEQSNF